jgi:hypothetical protein
MRSTTCCTIESLILTSFDVGTKDAKFNFDICFAIILNANVHYLFFDELRRNRCNAARFKVGFVECEQPSFGNRPLS